MERRKEVDPEGYKIYGLGEWGELGGLILTNFVIEDVDTSFDRYDKVLYSQDFGYNHANCILEIGFKDDEIYVLRELYVHEKDTVEKYTAPDGRFYAFFKGGHIATDGEHDSDYVAVEDGLISISRVYAQPVIADDKKGMDLVLDL